MRPVVLIGLMAWMTGSMAACAAPGSGSAGSGTGTGSAAAPPSETTAAGEQPAGLRYVALGDSYTIGTSVAFEERWPNQLVARLSAAAPAAAATTPGPSDATPAGAPATTLRLVANLGINGFTARDVIEAELPRLDGLRPEFVSILVGVNDVVQGVPSTTYRANAARILDVLRARLPADRIVAVGTPDYTVTPQGAAFGDPAQQSAGIRTNNQILRELAQARGIRFVDIYDLSLRAAADRSLVAADGLHPSGAQYALWVDRIAPVVAEMLGR